MMKRKGNTQAIVFGCIFITIFFAVISAQEFEKGKIITGVTCKADPGESYALYLPENYDKSRETAIVFAFEPGARTRLPLELYKSVADRFGYIVVCPANSQNGPWPPIFKAMKAVWRDVSQRFLVDRQRIYTTGFSGGSRASVLFSRIVSVPVAGIVACGAGLPQGVRATEVKPSYYYGIVGIEDYNYKEFVKLAGKLEKAGVDHTLEVVDGIHDWPKAPVITRAMEWLEISSMVNKTRPMDRDMISRVYEKSLVYGKQLEDRGRIFYAAKYYRHVLNHFKNLVELSGLHKELSRIVSSRGYKDFLVKEKKRNIRETNAIGRFAYVFFLARNEASESLKLKKILADLKVNDLVKESRKGADPFDRFMARRLLTELLIKGPREGEKALEKKDYPRAMIFFEIVSHAGTKNYLNMINLTRSYIGLGKKKKALQSLDRAVDLALDYDGGKYFPDPEKDPALLKLANEKRFREIMDRLKK